MEGDLIIKDVDLDYLKDDLDCLEEVFEDFKDGDSRYEEFIEKAGVRVLGMLKTWAEGRKAEKEDEELVEKITREVIAHYDGSSPISFGEVVRAGIEMAVKEQRKRLGK